VIAAFAFEVDTDHENATATVTAFGTDRRKAIWIAIGNGISTENIRIAATSNENGTAIDDDGTSSHRGPSIFGDRPWNPLGLWPLWSPLLYRFCLYPEAEGQPADRLPFHSF